VDLLVIDEPAFPSQKNVNPLVAISDPGCRDLFDPFSKGRIRVLAGLILIGCPVREQHSAGSSGGDSIGITQKINQLSLSGWL
jgi:hypothetical protein